MSLLDKDGNPITSESLRQKEEEEKVKQEEEHKEPEFKPLVDDFSNKVKELASNVFEKANLLNLELDQQQAMQIVGTIEQASINLLFKTLYEMDVDIDDIFTEENEDLVKKLFDFQKNIDTYSEEDLKNLEQSQNK